MRVCFLQLRLSGAFYTIVGLFPQSQPFSRSIRTQLAAFALSMSIIIKTPEEIDKMRTAGRAAAEVLEMIEEHVRPGITTVELDQICHDFMVNTQKVIPAPLNYRGFPKSICTSVNHQVCHGIPSDKKLKNGDIVNIDITVIKDGFHGDTSKMFMVGKPAVLTARLSEVAQQALWIGIHEVRPGATLGDVGHAIQRFAESHRYSVVREYCGHGIGRSFHEDPQVLHYGKPGDGVELRPGMCFTIEPMINAGKKEVKLLGDKWTVVTRDRKPSAQWEHTILVTDDGHEVLTLRREEMDQGN
jgi:methionyl aminopeptidase